MTHSRPGSMEAFQKIGIDIHTYRASLNVLHNSSVTKGVTDDVGKQSNKQTWQHGTEPPWSH